MLYQNNKNYSQFQQNQTNSQYLIIGAERRKGEASMMAVLRAALYERVSTEEQALRGFSIETQIDNLVEYCEKNKMKIVDHYTDEGISGAKPPTKRPALKRLLEDIEANKIDIVLFTKLDRWFRSVKEYYKVQEILESHNVEWKAIHEDYDTTTANGRMAITIFLAIAQNEREKTSERIQVVFEHKRKNKEVAFGGKDAPWGYKKERDENGVLRLVKDPETQAACEAFWEMMLKYENVTKAGRYVNETFGLNRAQRTWQDTMKNSFYCGVLRDVEDFCEPYISKKDWLRIIERRPIKSTQKKRVYLYTGMMKCPKCGRTLACTHTWNEYKGVKREYNAYRCPGRRTSNCDWTRSVSELKIEKYLLENLEPLLKAEISRVEQELAKPKPKPKINIPALKEKLRRLNVTYMAGNKSDEEYLKEDAEIKALIKKAETETPPEENRDLTPLKNLLKSDVLERYPTFDREEKRRFWRGVIKEIIVVGNSPVDAKFF